MMKVILTFTLVMSAVMFMIGGICLIIGEISFLFVKNVVMSIAKCLNENA